MSNLDLQIGGRSFRVACAPGEEDHVTRLGRMIDDKITAMGDMSGQAESRMLLFAALQLADELHEAVNRSAKPGGAPSENPALGERLESIAAALEKCARHLES